MKQDNNSNSETTYQITATCKWQPENRLEIDKLTANGTAIVSALGAAILEKLRPDAKTRTDMYKLAQEVEYHIVKPPTSGNYKNFKSDPWFCTNIIKHLVIPETTPEDLGKNLILKIGKRFLKRVTRMAGKEILYCDRYTIGLILDNEKNPATEAYGITIPMQNANKLIRQVYEDAQLAGRII
jgi:hypothetical protein